MHDRGFGAREVSSQANARGHDALDAEGLADAMGWDSGCLCLLVYVLDVDATEG